MYCTVKLSKRACHTLWNEIRVQIEYLYIRFGSVKCCWLNYMQTNHLANSKNVINSHLSALHSCALFENLNEYLHIQLMLPMCAVLFFWCIFRASTQIFSKLSSASLSLSSIYGTQYRAHTTNTSWSNRILHYTWLCSNVLLFYV